jgi:hypothetical protein
LTEGPGTLYDNRLLKTCYFVWKFFVVVVVVVVVVECKTTIWCPYENVVYPSV